MDRDGVRQHKKAGQILGGCSGNVLTVRGDRKGFSRVHPTLGSKLHLSLHSSYLQKMPLSVKEMQGNFCASYRRRAGDNEKSELCSLGRYFSVKIFHCILAWLSHWVIIAMLFACLSFLTYEMKVITFKYKMETQRQVCFVKQPFGTYTSPCAVPRSLTLSVQGQKRPDQSFLCISPCLKTALKS